MQEEEELQVLFTWMNALNCMFLSLFLVIFERKWSCIFEHCFHSIIIQPYCESAHIFTSFQQTMFLIPFMFEK